MRKQDYAASGRRGRARCSLGRRSHRLLTGVQVVIGGVSASSVRPMRQNYLDTRLRRCAVAKADGEDPKVAALRDQRSLNARPERVTDERFAGSEFLDARDLVQVKYEMVRRVRVDGDTVTQSAQAFGFSRPSFYEAAAAIDAGGLGALVPARPGPRRAHKLSDEVVGFLRERLAAEPGLRAADLVGMVEGRFGIN